MADLIQLQKQLMLFIEFEAEVYVTRRALPRPEKQRMIVGPFLSYPERKIWLRAFWIELPLDVRKRTNYNLKTHRFIDGRFIRYDINPRHPEGEAGCLAAQFEIAAQMRRLAVAIS
jgi:hypothetical protein